MCLSHIRIKWRGAQSALREEGGEGGGGCERGSGDHCPDWEESEGGEGLERKEQRSVQSERA